MVGSPAAERVWQVLDAVCDPEIPVVSLRELGILREVHADATGVEVVITPTYSGCPAMGQIEDDIRAALRDSPLPVRVTTRLLPAWTTDWITPEAREKLRQWGIAPPGLVAPGSPQVIRFATKSIAPHADLTRAQGHFGPETVPCPQCSSTDTVETSHFGSTACKAMYRCNACREPFDYFKPY